MSDPHRKAEKESPSLGRGPKFLLLLVAVVAAVAAFIGVRSMIDVDRGEDSQSLQLLDMTRTALAATENLATLEAEPTWAELAQRLPSDASIAKNRAINLVLRVDSLAERAMNPSLEDDEKRAARAALPDAMSAARAATDQFATVSGDAVMPLWLRSRIDMHEASLLPGSLTKSNRRKVYDRLSQAISGETGKLPGSMILGGGLIEVIDQMEDPIDGLPADVLSGAAKTVGQLSDQHPNNLFFALRAARLNIDTRQTVAAKFVDRASQLAKAVEPSIRRDTQAIGVTPDELVAEITAAIESGDWNLASNRLLLWFNVLNSTEIVKTDRRRASPHPLDLLNFDALRRFSADVVKASPLEQGQSALVLDVGTVAGSTDVTTTQVIDFDLDLDADIVTAHRDQSVRLWKREASDGAWAAAGTLQLDMVPAGLLVADLFMVDASDPQRLKVEAQADSNSEIDFSASNRHNTFSSLIAYGKEGVRLIRVDGRQSTDQGQRLTRVEGVTGLEEVDGVITATVGDLEADGDLDLVVATESDGIRVFVNRGNRTFFELDTFDNSFAIDDPVSSFAIADLDRDLDLDLVTTHAGSGRVAVIENLLHLQFRGRFLEAVPSVMGAAKVSVEDVDGNVSWDLVVVGSEGATIVFTQTADAGTWTVDRIESSAKLERNPGGTVIADFDNDSWFELLAGSNVTRLGPWGFTPWTSIDSVGNSNWHVVADFDRDGRQDIAGVLNGTATFAINMTDGVGHHVNVRFKGIADNASGRVNHYGIGSVLECRFGPHYRARIVDRPETHFGTDGFDTASSVRAILPNGLTQTIRDPKIDSLVEEEQTLKGSCPYLYAWDGEKFVFATDCLWAAPLGLQVARGVVAKDRPWEYLKIDGSKIRPRGDRYSFRITEELWEVAYFDKVALSVVDHPADVDVWTNEKVGPPEIATPTVFAFSKSDLRSLKSAVDTRGRDVTDQLANADRDFVQSFDQRLRQGLCPPHWIDMDFGKIELDSSRDGARIYLVLTGWILPTDTSLNIQIDQNPDLGPIEFPSVWVPDAKAVGGWRKAIPVMGFPGGKTKTIVVDVTDVVNQDDSRFRVRTSAQIYWDRAQLAVQSEPAPFHVEDVDLISAEVGRHGFSRSIKENSTIPEVYDYQDVTMTPRWPPLRGRLTRLGDCTDLVQQWDDEMVVISSGDEIRIEFSVPQTKLPRGWVRDFVLHSVGWDKDADLNTLSGQQTGPLPHREMSRYPPPANDGKQRQLEQSNRYHLQRTQSFREFWYRNQFEPSGRSPNGITTVPIITVTPRAN